MRMQKTDMEFVTFDAQDVIATSVPNLIISGYMNDRTDDLTFNFDGVDYTNANDLKNAISKYPDVTGGAYYAFNYSSRVKGGEDTFVQAFIDEADPDKYTPEQKALYSAGNGVYEWNVSSAIWKWLKEYNQ